MGPEDPIPRGDEDVLEDVLAVQLDISVGNIAIASINEEL